ncbi:MAG: hypothetical protein ACYCQL_00115 [Acidithiobacillus sp.]
MSENQNNNVKESVYRLWTPSDKNGNSLYRQVCPLSADVSPTKWILDSRWDRSVARDTYPEFRCEWCGPKRLPIGDHPDGAFPGQLFSQRAIEVLGDLLTVSGDLYKLSIVGCDSPYWLYICWTKIDALNMEKTIMARDHRVQHAAFKSDAILPPAFHVPQESGLWVTDTIKNKVEESGVSGFSFQHIGEVAAEW